MKNKIILGVFALFLLMQFIPTQKNTDENAWQNIQNEQQLGDELHQLFTNACYDCHSNNTTYPWYANIKPLAFWLNHHVDEGKEKFNFNELQQYSEKKYKHKLDELIEMIEKDEMPLTSYTLIHTNAKLSDAQKLQIINWAKAKINNRSR